MASEGVRGHQDASLLQLEVDVTGSCILRPYHVV